MNIFVWLMQNHLLDLRKGSTMATEKELKKLNDVLLIASCVKRHQTEDENSKFISSGIAVNNELKQIADLTAGIAASLLSLNTGIPDKYKINISQFAKIFQNIVWDSVMSFLRNDMLLAKKTFFRSLELKKICSRMQESLLEAGKTAGSAESSESTVLFIVQYIKDIAVHTVNITQTVTSGLDEVIN
jgi:phosphate uptake regulator